MARVAVGLVLVLALVGCGSKKATPRVVTAIGATTTGKARSPGDPYPATSPVPAPGPTFASQADSICTRYRNERLRLPQAPRGEAAVRREQADAASLLQRQEAELRQLAPPRAKAQRFESWLAAQIELVNETRALREPLVRLQLALQSPAKLGELQRDQRVVQARLGPVNDRLTLLSLQLGLRTCFIR